MSIESQGTDTAVYERYAAAAQEREDVLCCPVDYRTEHLSVIPDEILQRDYGCGDPTPYVREGETVLDLGSGGGKICYILSQVVGPTGRVIGVDCDRQMLALARKHRPTLAAAIGHDNVHFHCGRIQDLQLDLDCLADALAGHRVDSPDDWLQMLQVEDRLRRETPMIPDDSVDCVVSNCVLNLVRQEDRQQLFAEIFRVLQRDGRVAISDIEDGDGHVYDRGERMAVCDKTYRLLSREPYADQFELIEPRVPVPLGNAEPFACNGARRRPARESKGLDYHKTTGSPGTLCDQDGPCC